MQSLFEKRKNTTLYLVNGSNKELRLLKVLNHEKPSVEDLARFINEYETCKDLKIKGVRKVLKSYKANGKFSILLDFIEGKPLSQMKWDESLKSSRDFKEHLISILEIFQDLLGTMSKLHDASIIHRDIKPSNIIINSSGRPVLIDFGLAIHKFEKANFESNLDHLEGSLAYLAPEQTGRLNRSQDARTDLYSLGVCLYELLTGGVPFSGKDALEYIHQHLAVIPKPLTSVNPLIPPSVEKVVDKLLNKHPENRYQSVKGLADDLNIILQSLLNNRSMDHFIPGKIDQYKIFRIPEKLYGRELEVAKLIGLFEESAKGRLNIVRIIGESGSGKTALIKEIYQPVTRLNAAVVKGKWDPIQKTLPYLAIKEAFNELADHILMLEEDKLAGIVDALALAIPSQGRVLVDIVPNLEPLLNCSEKVQVLYGDAARNRIHFLFGKLLKVICDSGRPLTIVFDDMQWADSASLNLIESIVTYQQDLPILFIFNYRANEIGASHPINFFFKRLSNYKIEHHTIKCENLTIESTGSLVANSLQASEEDVFDLTAGIFLKTAGNAFHVLQLLDKLVKSKNLFYDQNKNQWDWNRGVFDEVMVSESLAQMMITKLGLLDHETLEILKAASCIGGRFSLKLLRDFLARPVKQLVVELESLIAEQYLTSINGSRRKFFAGMELEQDVQMTYAFSHDKIQEAAYALIPETKKPHFHIKLARILQNQVTKDAFLTVKNYNKAQELLVSNEEKIDVVNLNLECAKKSLDTGAYKPSESFAKAGLGMLPHDHWKSYYQLSLEFCNILTEIAALRGDIKSVEQFSKVIFDFAKKPLDKVSAYKSLIVATMARKDLSLALSTGLHALKDLGLKIPNDPGAFHLAEGFLKLNLALKGRVEALVQNPEVSDQRIKACVDLIVDLIPAAYRSGGNVFPLLVFHLVRLTARHGNSSAGVFGYASFAIAQCAVMKDYRKGYRFADLAIKLSESYPEVAHKFIFYNFIQHWMHPFKKSVDGMYEVYEKAREHGDLFTSTWGAFYHVLYHYFSGAPLGEVEEKLESLKYILLWDEGAKSSGQMLAQLLEDLQQDKAIPEFLDGAFYSGEQAKKRFQDHNDQIELCMYHLLKLKLFVLYGHPMAGLVHAKVCRENLPAVIPMFLQSLILFYEGIALCFTNLISPITYKQRSLVKKTIKQFKIWAKLNPTDFSYRYHLLLAEYLLHVEKKPREALNHFNFSLEIALEVGAPIFDIGLIYLKMSDYYEVSKHEHMKLVMIERAYKSFEEWGSLNLCKNILRNHAIFSADQRDSAEQSLDEHEEQKRMAHGNDSTATISSGQLDLDSIIKSSQIIASKIRINELLSNTLDIMIENAGAQRGVLALRNQDSWTVEMIRTIEQSGIQGERLATPINDKSLNLPASIFSLVGKTKRPVILDDAAIHTQYGSDPYFSKTAIKSVLCFVLEHQDIVTAVVYLENNAIDRAFNLERLAPLQVIGRGASIAIENSQLYENLEQKIVERTRELSDALKNLKETQSQLVETEKMAALGNLVAGVAHELNTPLGVSVTAASTLGNAYKDMNTQMKTGIKKSQLISFLQLVNQSSKVVLKSSQKANELVENFKQLAVNMSEEQKVKVNLKDHLKELLNVLSAHVPSEIELDYTCLEGIIIDTYQNSFNQIFKQLIMNSVQHGFAKGTKGRISIGFSREHNDLHINYKDNGLGIKADDLPKIFEPFFTTKRVFGSTGLGLHLVYNIVSQKFAGSIKCRSTHHEYTEFSIRIPSCVVDEKGVPSAA